MAEDRSVGGLYLRLGLSLSELETGFVTAERTVAANINRLNRESNLIRIRSEIEIAGLDETADAERILQIRTETLNRQMAIQRDRVRILTAELQNLTAAHGENAAVTQRATLRLERERLALANLERESRSLNSATDETNSAFGELSDLLPEMPTKLGAVQMALAGLTTGIGAAATVTKELLDEFRELQKQSYELNMPFPDTRDFLREMRLAGGDIGDIEGYIRGITDAYVKGEYDDPEFIALRKYGAEIVDATGRLKDFKDISEEVYQAWLKADEAGESIEFLQLLGGEMGVRDTIQYFQRLKEAREDAAKVFKAEFNDEQLHKLDRTMNLVTEQSGELKAALGDIFVPATQAAAEKFFNVLHNGTEYLVENKDELQKWYFVAVEVFDALSEKVGGFTDKLAEIAKAPKGTTGNAEVDKTMANMGWRYQDFNQQKPFGVNTDWDSFNEASKSYGILGDAVKHAEEKHKAFKGELKDATTVAGKMAQGLAALSDAQKKHGDVLSQYGDKRAKEFKDELEDLQIELEFGDDEYQKALAQLKLWRQRELTDKLHVSDKERNAIQELYAAKLEQIEQEHSDKIAESIREHWENYTDIEYDLTHSAFEKQLRDIELWKEAQEEKAETAEETAAIIAEAAAKEAQAFEQEMDRIKGKLQSLDDKIFDIDHSQYERDLRRIQQDYLKQAQEYQELGIFTPEIKARLDYLYGRQKYNLDQKAAESRAKGGDYTKRPEGAMQGGGNGIMVIGADQIVDDGLIQGQQQVIGLLTDENQIRSMMMTKLNDAARAEVEKIQAAKALTAAQQELIQSTQQAISGFQLIEGDNVANAPQVISGDQIISIPTEQLQQFGNALQQTATEIEQADPLQEYKAKLQEAANVQSSFVGGIKDFPPEYFKNLADSAKAVSEMQGLLTRSTMDLIKAQDNLATALSKLPTGNSNQSRDVSNNQPLPTDSGFLKLTDSTQDVSQAQDLLARTSREASDNLRRISDIPTRSDNGLKFGFDMDMAGLVAGLGSLALMGASAPISAPVLGGVAVTSLLAGLAKGSYDETTAPRGYDERLLPDVDLSEIKTALSGIDTNLQSVLEKLQSDTAQPEIDLSELVTPLSSIDEKTQSILQAIQDSQPYESDRLQELFGALPNIETYMQDILLELQSEDNETDLSEYLSVVPKISEDVQSILQSIHPANELTNAASSPQLLQMPEISAAVDYMPTLTTISGNVQSILQAVQTPVTFETVITPLNNINTAIGNILTALSNRQPPQINIAPSNNIDLGGAYVFDNELKKQLVDDITSQIVDKITSAVQQATRNSSYSYGA